MLQAKDLCPLLGESVGALVRVGGPHADTGLGVASCVSFGLRVGGGKPAN